MKLTKKILSAVTAMTMAVGASAMFPMTAYAEAVNWDKVLENGPEWLPYDFGSAMQFHNNYGTTKTDGDMICIVYHVPDFYKMSADISPFKRDDGMIAESEYEYNMYSFDFKLPETSERSGTKKYADPSDEMQQDVSTRISGVSSVGFHYEVIMILNNCAKGFDVDISLEDEQTGKTSESVRYTFVNEDGELKETDIYGWLPDSYKEFDNYINDNGNISLRDGMLIYCDNIYYSTGASLNVEQTGAGKLKLALNSSISRDNIIRATGTADSIIQVYKGETEGNVDITFTSGRSWDTDAEDHSVKAASVHVDEDLNVTESSKDIPDWIPDDYESAVDFFNEHGASFIMNGVICFVRRVNPRYIDEYPVRFKGSASEKIKKYELVNKIYADENNDYYGYNVMAYDIPNDSDITVIFKYGRFIENERTINSYSFEKDSTGYITQTDKYFWLPDCDEEFNAYYDKHGTFSIQGNYVMYCTNVPRSESGRITTQQNGSGFLIEDHEDIFSKQYVKENEPEGEQEHIIKLFKPVKAGVVKLVISNNKININDVAYFRITDKLQIIPAEENELKTTVKGDCNGDGEIGISDAVALQKWLLGKGELPDFGISDINGDGTVDVFDLIAVKKQIVNRIKDEPKPVMVILSQNFAWTPYQKATIIDQYGTGYTFTYNDNYEKGNDWEEIQKETISMYNKDWYDKLLDIIATCPKTAAYISDAAMYEINNISREAAKYSDEKMYSYGIMCDAGSSILYLVGTDSDGNPVNAEIAEFGDCVGWIEDQQIKNFVKMLAGYGIYGKNIIELLENNMDIY